jgi:hypothetical protein
VDRKIAGRRSSLERPAWSSSTNMPDVTQESGQTADVLVVDAVEIAR